MFAAVFIFLDFSGEKKSIAPAYNYQHELLIQEAFPREYSEIECDSGAVLKTPTFGVQLQGFTRNS